jgi:FtsZ-binding cell division protein ZapB
MQASTSQNTPAPAQAAPAAPVTITTVGADGNAQTIAIPRTSGEVEELVAQRRELSDQLTNVSQRRDNLAREIRNTADAGTRTGLQERLRVLDNRILQLETDLGTTGKQLSSAPADLLSESQVTSNPGGGDDFDEGFAAGGFSGLALMSVVLFFMRRRWKRGPSRRKNAPDSAAAERLERVEQGMEAIAIEIERVSEGQRFVTRLLSEAKPSNAPVARLEKEPLGARGDVPG